MEKKLPETTKTYFSNDLPRKIRISEEGFFWVGIKSEKYVSHSRSPTFRKKVKKRKVVHISPTEWSKGVKITSNIKSVAEVENSACISILSGAWSRNKSQ